MKQSGTIVLAVATFCIMALMAAAVSASVTPGQGRNGTPVQGPASQEYTMEQTLSDRGQENTIAFDALAFVSGDACSDTFLPPGKVADYAGFQYLRDNDPTQMGHNTDFVTRISDNVLYVLNEDQLDRFVALSETEIPLTTQYGYMRYPLTRAFRTQLDGTYPSSSSGLDKSAVMAYSAKLYDVDANISIARAKAYAGVIRSLNGTQRAYLDTMKSGGMASMPVVDTSQVLKNLGPGNSVAMRTYASEMYAWYAGSVEADVYFCPERQATYFGSFYMKDRPAMGNAGYSISTSLTGDSGEGFLNMLTADQREKVTDLVDLQRADLNEIVATRTAIATELRKALNGETIDEAKVHSLSARYGELDGEISYLYAKHFAEVGTTLTSDQKAQAAALRNLAGYSCEGGYLYSQPIDYPANVPFVFLFGGGTYDPAEVTSWLESQTVTMVLTGQSGQAGRQGNTTLTGQGSGGNGKNPERQSSAGNRSWSNNRQEQEATPGQQNRIPMEEVIMQLGQKGYDISGVQSALQSGDRDAMNAWMKEFKNNNPGVAEAIEGIPTSQPPHGPGNQGNSLVQDQPGGQQSRAGGRNPDPIGWLTRFWMSLWEGK